MVTKKSRNGLIESLLVPNDKRKESNALNLKLILKRNS